MKIRFKFVALMAIPMLVSADGFAHNHGVKEESATLPYSIVYSSRESKGRSIYLSDEEGTSRLKLTNHTPSDGYPSVSPDGKFVAFYGKYDDYKTWSIHTVRTDGTQVKRLTTEKHVWDSAPSWSPDGRTIIFSREFEDDNGEWHEQVWLMDPDGSNKRQIKPIKGRSAQFMSDGRILFQSKTGPSQISIADIDGKNIVQLTNDDANNRSPKISPDGKRIVFLSNRDGNQEVYTMKVDGSEQKRMTFNEVEDWDPAWSVDGEHLFFITANDNNFYDIFKMSQDGTSLTKVLNQGSQISSVKKLDKTYLKELITTRKKEQSASVSD